MKAFAHAFLSIAKLQVIIHVVMIAILSPLLLIEWNFLFKMLWLCGCCLAAIVTMGLMSWGLGGRHQYTRDTGFRIGKVKVMQEHVEYHEGQSYAHGFAAIVFLLFVQLPFIWFAT